MNKIYAILLVTLMAFSAKAETIIAVGDLWPPLNNGVEGLPPSGGLSVDVAKRVFEVAGLKVEMHLYPWKRCMLMLRSGEADMAWQLTKNSSRETYMYFTEPTFVIPYKIYSLKETKFDWNDWSDLTQYSVGIVDGFNYGDAFFMNTQKLGVFVYRTTTDDKLLNLLMNRRVDTVVFNEVIANKLLNDAGVEHYIQKNAKPISTPNYHMSISKAANKKHIIERLNKAIVATRPYIQSLGLQTP